jgi:hypothetical protein
LGTKFIKIREQKLQKFGNKSYKKFKNPETKFRNKNLGTKVKKSRNKNYKNTGTKTTKIWE